MSRAPRNPAHSTAPSPLGTAETSGEPEEGKNDSLGQRLLLQQRDAWLRGEGVLVEALFAQYPQLRSEEEVVLDLIYHEFVMRQEVGQPPQPEEYLRRFPDHRERLQRLFALDDELRVSGLLSTAAGRAGPPWPLAGMPAKIGKYPVIAPLGAGGQARVFRAVHPDLGRDVVIKVGHALLSDAAEPRDRLREEARILADLEHPNLARVYDAGVDQGRAFLVLEYVRGLNLRQYAAQHRLGPRQAAALVAAVARGLAVLHRRGVVHLDIKPNNILVDETGRPRLIDFGLARWRHAWASDPDPGVVCGTPAFMAPEQARGEAGQIGTASDLFALGGVLFFLLTAQEPFASPCLGEALRRARACQWDRAALVRARAPSRLRALCRRALAEDPADRHPGAADLAADLEAYLRWPARRLWLGASAALLAVLLLSWLVWRCLPAAAPVRDVARVPDRPADVAGLNPALAAPGPRHLSLRLRVWSGDHYTGLIPPLRTGDRFQVLVEAPADAHLGLFQLLPDGRWQLLAARPPPGLPGAWRYPASEDQAVPLLGPPGTEFLLACARRSAAIGVADLPPAGERGAWPALPASSVLRLQKDGIVFDQRGRPAGPAQDLPDPEAAVRRRLEALRSALTERVEFFEGVAFAQRP